MIIECFYWQCPANKKQKRQIESGKKRRYKREEEHTQNKVEEYRKGVNKGREEIQEKDRRERERLGGKGEEDEKEGEIKGVKGSEGI